MSYPLLHELLDLVERYEEFRGNAEQSMSNFLRFADQSLEQQASTEESKTGSKGDAYLNAVIARDISFVYRYMRYLVRKAIKDTPLQTIDEYSYLITLMAKGEMTKTELNNYNVVEKTSGSEIIRRLLKSGLISQTRNLEDRRSLLLSITPEGRKVVKELLPRMQQSSDLLLRDLSWDQKTSGSEIIRRLLKSGLISQTRNLEDRRSLLLSITPEGRKVVKELLPRMQQSSDLLLRDLSWDQKIFLHTLHEQLYESNHPLFLTERDTDLEELLKKVPIKQATRPNK